MWQFLQTIQYYIHGAYVSYTLYLSAKCTMRTGSRLVDIVTASWEVEGKWYVTLS